MNMPADSIHIAAAGCTHNCPTEPCGAVDIRRAHPDCTAHRPPAEHGLVGAHWPPMGCRRPASPPPRPTRPHPLDALTDAQLAAITRAVYREIRQWDPDDELNAEIRRIYRAHGVNPPHSCDLCGEDHDPEAPCPTIGQILSDQAAHRP